MEHPQVVYKYVNAEHGLSNLRFRRVKVTPVREANDLLEFPVEFTGEPTVRDLRALSRHKDVWRLYYENRVRHSRPGVTWKQFKKTEIGDRSSQIEQLRRGFPEILANCNRTWYRRISQGGIISCSATVTSTLLWAHYANNDGVAVGLSRTGWGMRHVAFQPVSYGPVPPPIDLASFLTMSYQQMVQVISRRSVAKTEDWKYEQEYRLLTELVECTSVENPGAPGTTLFFSPVLPIHVRRVVYGPKCTERTRAAYREILNEPHYSHVVQQAVSKTPSGIVVHNL